MKKGFVIPMLLLSCGGGSEPKTRPPHPGCTGFLTEQVACPASRPSAPQAWCNLVDPVVAQSCADLCADGCLRAETTNFAFSSYVIADLRPVSSDPPGQTYPFFSIAFGNQDSYGNLDIWMNGLTCDTYPPVRGFIRGDSAQADRFSVYGSYGTQLGNTTVVALGTVTRRDAMNHPTEISLRVRRYLSYSSGVHSEIHEGTGRVSPTRCP